MNFPFTYNGLGRMFILQKNYGFAVRTLSAGLRRADEDTKEANVLRYKLLQNLGWAYYANGEYELAQEKLEDAIALENDKTVGRNSPAHYFLAKMLEAKGMSELACEHWDLSQRHLLDSEFLYQEGWESTIREQNQKCSKGDKQ